MIRIAKVVIALMCFYRFAQAQTPQVTANSPAQNQMNAAVLWVIGILKNLPALKGGF